MKSVTIPKFFHEVLGTRSTVWELVIIGIFSLVTSTLLLTSTYFEWKSLEVYRVLVIVLLTLDISGGVIANFTLSTNNYYAKRPKARLVFIALHVQPLILAIVAGNYFLPCIFVWCYTVISSLIINSMVKHPLQKFVGGFFTMSGLFALLLFFNSVPKFLFILLVFYLIKVVFSFSVDHYAVREESYG